MYSVLKAQLLSQAMNLATKQNQRVYYMIHDDETGNYVEFNSGSQMPYHTKVRSILGKIIGKKLNRRVKRTLRVTSQRKVALLHAKDLTSSMTDGSANCIIRKQRAETTSGA